MGLPGDWARCARHQVKMDATALRERVGWTFDANADLRRQAELDLKHVIETGFTGS